jgi:CBS-domain-containing membrane protein
MKASDVMVTNVITVRPDTTVQEIANILVTNRISAVPVVDANGALVGIVSEGDLMHRVETGTERRYSWWLKMIGDRSAFARDFLKSHGIRAAEVMTRHVVTAAPDTPLGELASLLEKHRIKRVPIVDRGRLVGIVSRANLVQALAALRHAAAAPARMDDAATRERIIAEISDKLLAGVSQINVIVHDGVVELWGEAETAEEKDAIRLAAEITPGVRRVEDHIAVNQHLSRA